MLCVHLTPNHSAGIQPGQLCYCRQQGAPWDPLFSQMDFSGAAFSTDWFSGQGWLKACRLMEACFVIWALLFVEDYWHTWHHLRGLHGFISAELWLLWQVADTAIAGTDTCFYRKLCSLGEGVISCTQEMFKFLLAKTKFAWWGHKLKTLICRIIWFNTAAWYEFLLGVLELLTWAAQC